LSKFWTKIELKSGKLQIEINGFFFERLMGVSENFKKNVIESLSES